MPRFTTIARKGPASATSIDSAVSPAVVETPIYDRYRLPAEAAFAGPAIIEERDSTAVIGPGATVRVDATANLIVTLHYEDQAGDDQSGEDQAA